jgi:DNA helicase-2/ATP-dependent DNA helicase PcrA
MRRDIPYEYRGGLKFFERAHVKDIVMHLRLKANPKDEVAWMRVLGLQTGIGLVTAQKMIHQIRKVESFDEMVGLTMEVGAKAMNGWKTLATTLKKMTTQNTPAECIRTVASSEYRAYLEAEYPDFLDRCEDIEQFAIFAEQYKDITTFLTDVSLTNEYGVLDEETHGDEERLILSTVHQAKGLEWDAVFIMNLVDGKFPNGRALEERDGLEEERRLFYVATTRARKFLYYTYPLVSGSESLLFNQPSMFLQELDPAMMEEVRLKREISPFGKGGTKSGSVFEMRQSTVWDDDEETIEVDEFGEEVKKKPPTSIGGFLRDV